MTAFYGRVAPWVAGGLILSCPFYYLDVVRLLCFVLFLLVSMPTWLTSTSRKFPAGLLPWAVFLGWATLSLGWSAQPHYSLVQVITQVLAPLLLYCGYAWIASFSEGWQAVMVASRVGLFLIATLVLAEWGGGAVPLYYPGWLQDQAVASTALLLLLPSVIPTLTSRRLVDRTISVVLLSMAVVAAWRIGNRMFWLAALFGFLCGGLYLVRKRPEFLGRPVLVISVVALMLVCAGGFELAAKAKQASTVSGGQGGAVASITHSERYDIWHFWTQQWRKHPWVGVGYGRYLPGALYGGLRPKSLGAAFYGAHAHNMYFDAALQLGVVGFVLFCAACGNWLRLIWLSKRDLALAGMAMVTVSAWLAKNMTDDAWQDGYIWLTFALAGAFVGRLCDSVGPVGLLGGEGPEHIEP